MKEAWLANAPLISVDASDFVEAAAAMRELGYQSTAEVRRMWPGGMDAQMMCSLGVSLPTLVGIKKTGRTRAGAFYWRQDQIGEMYIASMKWYEILHGIWSWQEEGST